MTGGSFSFIFYLSLESSKQKELFLNPLISKIIKNSGVQLASVYAESEFINSTEEFAPTNIPMLNVALSGKWNGGISSGITILAGPSRMGKTFIGLIFVKAYLDKYPDAVCLFVDTEFGAGKGYFDRLGIDTERVIHMPIKNVEEAKFALTGIYDKTDRGEHIITFFDSIGNIASKKEMEDAIDGKSVQDMSRAKQLKSFFRIITPYLNLLNIPFIGINHTYQTTDFFPQTTMSGGTGTMYSANTVLFLSKSKDKDGTTVTGFDFKLKAEKSRFIREGSVFSMNVSFEEGIDPYSDLFDFALESGFITSPSKGFYQKNEKYGDQTKYRKSAFERNPEIWQDLITDEDFIHAYEKKYSFV